MYVLLLQRQLIAQKMKQKRQTGAGGMVQASNISSAGLTGRTAVWQSDLHGMIWMHYTQLHRNLFFHAIMPMCYTLRVFIHSLLTGYDGPLQYSMIPGNPDTLPGNRTMETDMTTGIIFYINST